MNIEQYLILLKWQWVPLRGAWVRTQAELKSLLLESVPQFSDIYVDTWSNIS